MNSCKCFCKNIFGERKLLETPICQWNKTGSENALINCPFANWVVKFNRSRKIEQISMFLLFSVVCCRNMVNKIMYLYEQVSEVWSFVFTKSWVLISLFYNKKLYNIRTSYENTTTVWSIWTTLGIFKHFPNRIFPILLWNLGESSMRLQFASTHDALHLSPVLSWIFTQDQFGNSVF